MRVPPPLSSGTMVKVAVRSIAPMSGGSGTIVTPGRSPSAMTFGFGERPASTSLASGTFWWTSGRMRMARRCAASTFGQ
jgi:hypothetical protein